MMLAAAGGAFALPHRAHAGPIDSTIAGVPIGVQSYSFRDRPLGDAIAGMAAAGIGSCELWQGHVEPPARSDAPPETAREELRRWRLTVPLTEFRSIAERFAAAGVALSAYNLSFRDDFTGEEIERGFEMARALGVKVMTASSTLSVVPRVDRVAQRYSIPVGMHNHSDKTPNEFSGPDDFAAAMKGASPFIAINLDIGHFAAANHDAVPFLRQHHSRIVSLHIKDKKRNDGDYTPFGQGDAPIVEVLRMLRDEKWAIPANIEYEYKGDDTVAEVKRCLDYCRKALTERSQ
jgi:sugar phosphate isomerase/epimerase